MVANGCPGRRASARGVVVWSGSESEGVVWAGGVVCAMVLQRVDERRAAERATVPSSPSGQACSLAAGSHLTATSGKQERLAGSGAPSQR